MIPNPFYPSTVTQQAALHLAAKAHDHQRRKFDGELYIYHPMRVATIVMRAGGSDDQIVAALLHDVIEETNVTSEMLLEGGIPQNALDIVDHVTKRDSETHNEFVQRSADTPQSWLVKRSDILDNLSTLPIGHSLMARYAIDLVALDKIARNKEYA